MILPGQIVIKRLRWDINSSVVGIVIHKKDHTAQATKHARESKDCLVFWVNNTVSWHFASMLRAIETEEDLKQIREATCITK